MLTRTSTTTAKPLIPEGSQPASSNLPRLIAVIRSNDPSRIEAKRVKGGREGEQTRVQAAASRAGDSGSGIQVGEARGEGARMEADSTVAASGLPAGLQQRARRGEVAE